MPGDETAVGAQSDNALDTALKINGDMAPETAYALTQQPGLDGSTMGHASKFMDAYGKIKESAGELAKEPADSPGFFSLHTLGAIADSVKGDVDRAGSFVKNFTFDLPGAIKSFGEQTYKAANDAAERVTTTGVELASGGGATWTPGGLLGHIEGENGKAPTIDWKNLGEEAYGELKQAANPLAHPSALINPGTPLPGAGLNQEMQEATAALDNAYAKYKAQPTDANETAVKAQYQKYKSLQSAYAANGNIEDAVNTLHNASPVNLLFGRDNIFFMMSHTMAYVESLAAKKGWAYALSQLAPPAAVAILTDGALSEEIGVGTETYDENLIAQADRLTASGKELSAEQQQAVNDAMDRQNARQLVEAARNTTYKVDPETGEMTLDDRTVAAQRKLEEALEKGGAVKRALYNAADFTGKVASPFMRVARGLMAPASDVRMNLMYQAVQAAAMGNPDDAALWNRTANLQVVGPNGQDMGQDGTALLKMMDLDPHSMWFSTLTDVADLADFYTKWLGSDAFGAVGEIVGRARTAEGLKGTLGKWFSGLRITDIESAERAAQQYPRVLSAFRVQAEADSAAEIADRFPGTYTSRQAAQLARLHTVDEVIVWHGNMAAAGELAKPLAPTWSAFDALKQELLNRTGDALHITGIATPQDARFMLQLASPEELDRVGLNPEGMGSLAANPDVEVTSTRNFGRFLGTRLGRNPANAIDYLERASGYMNPLSDDFPRRLMDMSRIALLPEKYVKAIGEVAIDATAQERTQMYYKIMAQVAERRIWAGIDDGVVASLKPVVDNMIWNEALNAAGHDGGGAVEGAQMLAGPDGAEMTRTYDPEDPDRDPKAAAVRLGQTGHLRMFRPNELRGLGVYTRQILQELPDKLVSDARFYYAATDDIEKVAEDTNATLGVVKDRMADLMNNTPSDLVRHQIGGYRSALTLLRQQIESKEATSAGESVRNFADVFNDLRNSLNNSKFLESLSAEREMVLKSRLDAATKEARLAALDAQIPPEFGLKSLGDMRGGLRGRLYGQIRALEDVGRTFTNQLSIHDTASFDEIERTYRDYQKYVLDRPDVDENLSKEFAIRFSELKAKRPDFLNSYFSKIAFLNHLLNRLWVPAALFSGAWSFHISVSEGALNTLRNGFLDTYDSELAARIAKHAIANPTGSYFDGLVSDITGRVKSFLVNDPEFEHDEGGLLAKVASKALYGAYNILRDAASGTALGFERLLLSGMDDAARSRMIGDFVDTIASEDGHLPMRINHVSSTFEGENMDKAMRERVWGVDQYGNPQSAQVFVGSKWRQIGTSDHGYASALSNWMNQIANDPVEGPIAKALYRRVYAEGTNGLSADAFKEMTDQEILDRGARAFRSQAAWSELEDSVKADARAHIESLPTQVRERMLRNKELMNEAMTERDAMGNPLNDPVADWAKATTYDVMHTVSGTTSPFRGESEHFIHGSLLDQVAKNQVKDGHDLIEDISAMRKGTEPGYIPTRMTDRRLEYNGLDKLHFINTISDYGHHYVFGPIANSLVRDPLYLLSVHQEFEEIRDTMNGLLTEDQMLVLAKTRAAEKMIRFVHNPLDKMVVEQNLRVVAPFYFAQNQSLRRAMRLLFDDPGAFEKYLKLSLGVTNWISSDTKNGEEPFLYIPGSTVIGKIASLPGRLLGRSASNFLFNSEDFALAGSTGSVSSMFPTGPINSVNGIAGNLLRPSGGPFENLTGEAIEALMAHVPWTTRAINRYVQNAINFIEGPEASQSSAGYQFDPSSVFRAFEEWGVSMLEWPGWVNPSPTNKAVSSLTNSNTILSSLLLTMNDAADTAYKRYVNEFLTKFQKDNNLSNSQMRAEMANGRVAREVSGWAAGQFSIYLQNHQQEFISSALQTNATLLAQKIIATIFSPLSPDIQGNFSKAQDFDKMLTEKNPNGTYKYTYDEAKAAFEAKYPSNILDLAARSFDTAGPWPETKSTVEFIQKYPRIVKEYPWAAAYLQNANEPYYGPAFDTLIANDLRQRDTPQEFVDQMLINSGEQYYREVLTNKYPNDEAGWSQLKEAAVSYGQTSNPTWLAYHEGSLYGHSSTASLNQMAQMVDDKTIGNAVFGGATIRGDFKTLVQMTQDAIAQYHAATSTSERDNLANTWYDGIQKMIEHPARYNVPQVCVTFLQDVMQNALEHLDE